MRLNLGSGNNLIDGYINIDKFDPAADLQADMADVDFPDESVEEIVVYQALEHTPWHQLDAILSNCYRMLEKGGKLTIEVPDLEWVCVQILQEGLTQKWHDNIYGGYYRPWDKDRYPDWDFHKGSVHYQGFTWAKLRLALFDAGFETVKKHELDEKHPDYQYEENLSVEAIK